MKKILFAAALAGLGLPVASNASIIVGLSSPSGGMTVAPGSDIEAVVSGATDNPNGTQNIQARIQESITGSIGTNPESSPFSANVVNTKVTTLTQPVVTSFFAPFATDSNITLGIPTAKFVTTANGYQPNSTLGNEPLIGITSQTASSQEFGDFYSANTPLTQTKYGEVEFSIPSDVAAGTVITFSLTAANNGLSGTEWADQNGDTSSVTETTAPNSTFQITVGTTPEPASLGLVGTAIAGMMLRRRRLA